MTTGLRIPADELREEFSRSSGPGGQGVNKLETRVTLVYSLSTSRVLDEGQRDLIRKFWSARISKSGDFRVSCEEARSQVDNRQLVRERLVAMLRQALETSPRRIATRRTRASQRRRMDDKRKRGDLKRGRGGSWDQD